MVESVTGWDPGKQFLPALPAAIFIYMSVFIIGLLLHSFTRMVVPSPIKGFILDFVKTMTFCAFPFGHGIMRNQYGEPGYMCAMVPLVFLSIFTLRGGDGNPISVWHQYYRRIIPLWKCVIKTLIQISAGFAAYRLGMYILTLELHPLYVERVKDYYNEFCSSDLRVPVYVGFLIEFFAVIYDCWFSNQTFTGNQYVDTIIKIVNSGLLVVSGKPDTFYTTLCIYMYVYIRSKKKIHVSATQTNPIFPGLTRYLNTTFVFFTKLSIEKFYSTACHSFLIR